MPTAANSLNISTTGVPYFTGTGFSAPTLTQHGHIIAGASNAIASTAVASNGQLLIGSTGADPVLAAITSSDSSITITLGAGTINLSAAPSILTLGAFGAVPNANGLSLTGALNNVLNMQPADATHPGGVSIAAQSFAGVKTFVSAPILPLTGLLIGNGASAVSAQTVTQHDVLIGAAANGITSVAPSATVGVALVSTGAAADPAFGTVVVAGGGTGVTSLTAFAPIFGGTTTTGAVQQVAVGTTGQVLTSNGAGALASFQTPASGGFLWASIASTPTTSNNAGYMATAALTVTLPSAPADGFIVGLLNASAGTVLFQAAGADKIQVGSAVGAAAGSATSTVKGDELTLIYQASGAIWFGLPPQGNWSVA